LAEHSIGQVRQAEELVAARWERGDGDLVPGPLSHEKRPAKVTQTIGHGGIQGRFDGGRKTIGSESDAVGPAALVYEPKNLTRFGRDLAWNESKHAGQRIALEPDFVDPLGGQRHRGQA